MLIRFTLKKDYNVSFNKEVIKTEYNIYFKNSHELADIINNTYKLRDISNDGDYSWKNIAKDYKNLFL